MNLELSWDRVAVAFPFLLALIGTVFNGSIRRLVWESWLEQRLRGNRAIPDDQVMNAARRVVRRHELLPSGFLISAGAVQLIAAEAGPVVAVWMAVFVVLLVLVVLGRRTEDNANPFVEPARSWPGSWLVGLTSVAGFLGAFTLGSH